MAVRTMMDDHLACSMLAAGDLNVEEVTNYPGHETNRVSHAYYDADGIPKCPHDRDPEYTFKKGPGCSSRCRTFGALYMKTEHEGKVLSLREMNGYDDSDFYALVWDDTAAKPVEVWYATTRGWTYPNNAWIDATPDVVEKWRAFREEADRKARAAHAEKVAKTPAKGKTLKVVKGRKVPKGTVGTCIWAGMTRYGERVGIKDSAGEVHWTAASNVEVVL